MNKNLLFASASFHIPKYYNNSLRENEYLFCLKQLLRFIPYNYDIIVCDNTINTIDEIESNELKNELNNVNFIILNRNIGTNNIGMGELDELIHVCSNVDFKKYEKVAYFTLRKIITNPYVFEKAANMKKDALISNPPFLHIKPNYQFNYSKPSKQLFNDMFFVLKSDIMLKYVEYSMSNMTYNIHNKIGSEQNLFNFINDQNVDYEEIDSLGFIRIDYKSHNEIQLI
jgi:hypothetical protein